MKELSPGDQVTIHYPKTRHVLHAKHSCLTPRDITIRNVRDLVADPLTPAEFLRRPYLLRSRWLVNATEHLAKETRHRQFYFGSSVEYRRAGILRLAWYSPDSPRPMSLLRKEFQPTLRDRKVLIKTIRKIQAVDLDTDLQLRIVADDFRIVA